MPVPAHRSVFRERLAEPLTTAFTMKAYHSGHGAARLARRSGGAEVPGSNPGVPTIWSPHSMPQYATIGLAACACQVLYPIHVVSGNCAGNDVFYGIRPIPTR